MELSSDILHPVEQSLVEPVKPYTAVQLAYCLLSEVTKIFAAKLFLEFLGKRFLQEAGKKMPREIYLATVFAPIVEEIIFRGVVLPGIGLMQKGYNAYRKHDLTEQDKKIQLIFRVQLSALIFAAMHLTNPHKTVASALIQFTWSYTGGVVYGYLSEKYNTISVSILVHGFNNSLVMAAAVYPSYPAPYFLLAIFASRINFYILGITNIDRKIAAKVYQAGTTCVALLGRVVQWATQQTAARAA